MSPPRRLSVRLATWRKQEMRSLGVKTVVTLSLFAIAASSAYAENHRIIYTPTKDAIVAKGGANLSFHGGPVIPSAKVVFIFWGPNFANVAHADHLYATTLQAFRDQFGTNGEYNTITQYSGSNGTVALSNLGSGTADVFDTTNPPTNVTDAIVQSEATTHGGTDTNTIYEVVIPS